MSSEYQELRAALGIPEGASHERALEIARDVANRPEKDPCCSVKIPEELHGDDFVKAWNRWGRYRTERKLPKYKPIGLQAQLNKLAKMGAKRSIAAIEFSICQNYQGIYEERGTPNSGNAPVSAHNNNLNRDAVADYQNIRPNRRFVGLEVGADRPRDATGGPGTGGDAQ